MTDKPTQFIEKLLSAQDLSPAMRASYRQELEAMQHPRLTLRSAAPGTALMVVLIVCVLGVLRNMLFYPGAPLVMAGWGIMVVTFAWAAALIGRDLWRGRHSPQSALAVATALTFAAGAITVSALLMGLSAPTDPKSMFNAFFVFVFYVACSEWRLDGRIAAGELAAREQALRLECRLADLAERLSG